MWKEATEATSSGSPNRPSVHGMVRLEAEGARPAHPRDDGTQPLR